MTGTAREVAAEMWSVYRLPVVRIPTNRPPKRKDLGTRVYPTLDAKWRAVIARIEAEHERGGATLVGTRSVEASEYLSGLLDEKGLAHRVLNARQDREEADIVADAGQPGRITVATNMAGRGTDIRLSPEVVSAGGLLVIATERHEAARIDRQLFGRCGRQGDPGRYEVIVSLEDELFHAHGAGLGGILRFAGGARSGLRQLAVRMAQRRGERLHARMRRALLKVDDQTSSLLAFSGRGE